MAAGSHAENGIWALFVQAAITTRAAVTVHRDDENVFIWVKLKLPDAIIKEIDSKIITSPIRFDRAVSMPALKDLIFW